MHIPLYVVCALLGAGAGFFLKNIFIIILSFLWLLSLFVLVYPDPDSSRQGRQGVFIGLAGATAFAGAMWLAYGIRWVGHFSLAEISSFFLR